VPCCSWQLAKEELVAKVRMARMTIAPCFFGANNVDRCPMEDSIWSDLKKRKSCFMLVACNGGPQTTSISSPIAVCVTFPKRRIHLGGRKLSSLCKPDLFYNSSGWTVSLYFLTDQNRSRVHQYQFRIGRQPSRVPPRQMSPHANPDELVISEDPLHVNYPTVAY
jgi:hypothetical protein